MQLRIGTFLCCLALTACSADMIGQAPKQPVNETPAAPPVAVNPPAQNPTPVQSSPPVAGAPASPDSPFVPDVLPDDSTREPAGKKGKKRKGSKPPGDKK
jgi:hypothetical protein